MNEIYKRLHNINLFENPSDIDKLSLYFYISESEKIKEQILETNITPPLVSEESNIKSLISTHIIPNSIKKYKTRQLPPDNLFWNIFITVYGEAEYLRIGSKFTNREWEEKNNIRSFFTNKSKELQTTNHKITLGNIKEMMSEYMISTSTTLLGLIGLSVYYKMPIILVDLEKRTHLSFLPINTDNESLIMIKIKGKGKLPDYYEVGDESILKNTFSLASYTRPLRAISTYKRAELDDIAIITKIDYEQKTKDELYRLLSERLVW